MSIDSNNDISNYVIDKKLKSKANKIFVFLIVLPLILSVAIFEYQSNIGGLIFTGAFILYLSLISSGFIYTKIKCPKCSERLAVENAIEDLGKDKQLYIVCHRCKTKSRTGIVFE